MHGDLSADPRQGAAGLDIGLKVSSNGFSEAHEPIGYIAGRNARGKAAHAAACQAAMVAGGWEGTHSMILRKVSSAGW